jgi:RNA polymerase sigma factor (sigma-70 family)
MDDDELLRAYREHRSDQAFTELVERHLPLVYGVAMRVVHEPHTAEDVAQAVFIQLARKASSIREGQAVAGWLYRATQHDALDALRNEKRRRQRETEAMKLAQESSRPEIAAEQLTPFLEQAMGQLRRVEQDAVVLRFFQGKSLRETGQALAMSEEAARKRVDRALDKMRAYFARCGITASAALLTSALSAHAAGAPAPAGLAAKIAGCSPAGKIGAGGFSHSIVKLIFMNTTAKLAIGGVLVVAAGTAFEIGVWTGNIKAHGGSFSHIAANHSQSFASAGSGPAPVMTREEALRQWESLLQSPLSIHASPAAVQARNALQMDLDRRTNPMDFLFLLENIAKLPSSIERDRIESGFLSRLSVTDPTTALSLANTYIDGQQTRDGLTQDIFNHLGAFNHQLGLTELAKLLPSKQTQQDYGAFFSAWVQVNDAANAADAAAEAAALPVASERSQALQSVANNWVEYDPQAALDWASGLPPADAGVLGQILTKVGKQEPALAAQYVDNVQDASVRNQDIQSVARAWALGAGQDPAAALNWLDQVATGDTYDNNVQYILGNLSKANPATAATLVENVNEPGVRDAVIATVAANWGSQDPQAALIWLKSLPNSDAAVRDSAIQKLMAASTTP